MKFSVIVPSYNQDRFITQTLDNLKTIRQMARQEGHELEILLFDSESGPAVQQILQNYKADIDFLEVKKDQGQYDAINKGLSMAKGDYWTWLNTDDLILPEGFKGVIKSLTEDPSIDYIYGNIEYIDVHNRSQKIIKAWTLRLEQLSGSVASVFQPGSWFKKEFTDKICALQPYQCCFDYEYICRLIKSGGKIKYLDKTLSQFRYYPESKSGSIVKKFVSEQWTISRFYGRKWHQPLTWLLLIRKFKHFLFSRA